MTDHLITRPAKITQCSRCSALTATAIVGGLTTVTDVNPLSIDEEIAAILSCRATFNMQITGTQIYLEWRDLTRIRAGRDYPVVAIHGCPRSNQYPIPPMPGEVLPDDPPF